MKKNRDDANKAIDKYESEFDASMTPSGQDFEIHRDALGNAEGVEFNPQYRITEMDPLDVVRQKQEYQAQQIAEQNAPKPLSVSQYAQNAKALKSKMAREFARKYGYADMGEAMKHIDDITNSKILAYADQNRNAFYDSLGNGGLTQESLPGILKQVDEYNRAVTPIGGAPIDLKDVVSWFANKVSNVDSGGRINQMVAPASGLPFRNVPVPDAAGNVVGYRPEYVRNAGTIDKTMTPAQIQSAKQAAANAAWKQYNDDRNYGLDVWKANQSAATARDKYNLDREKYEYLKENGLYGQKGNKQTKGAKAAANSLSTLIAEIDELNKGGAEAAPAARAKMEEMKDTIEAAFNKGDLDEEDRDFFMALWRGKRGEHYKYNSSNPDYEGAEDNAAMEFGQIPAELWDSLGYGSLYGKQPYK
jgi:hypothetical protein